MLSSSPSDVDRGASWYNGYSAPLSFRFRWYRRWRGPCSISTLFATPAMSARAARRQTNFRRRNRLSSHSHRPRRSGQVVSRSGPEGDWSNLRDSDRPPGDLAGALDSSGPKI